MRLANRASDIGGLVLAMATVSALLLSGAFLSADPPRAIEEEAAAPGSAIKPADFDRVIAPLLARRCLGCHNGSDKKGGLDLSAAGPAAEGGDSGTVIEPGKPEQSLLWERVSKNEMPPKTPLPPAERQLLRAWLSSGAKWGPGPIDLFRYTSDSRAGYDWWALQPVARPSLPAVKDAPWPRNDIDRFLLAGLEAKGLRPSAPADRRTLIRRLTFDLLGLPPTPAEVAAFLADDAPGAYATLVDRLLASPHYGEHWGRHWLDVARYGESQGFERDKLRPNAWQYRDWVIAAFNADTPYDEFVRLQLAGDVLFPDDPRAVIATGFLVAAPWDEVGQVQQSAAMKAVVRQDELEDLAGVTGQTFLGLTVHCARCHDHKFDPISQVEYYRVCACLSGVRHGERESLTEAGRVKAAAGREAFEARVPELQRQLAAIDDPIRARLLAARKTQAPASIPRPLPIARWEFDGDLKDSVGELHGTALGKARVEGGRLVLDGIDSYVTTAPLSQDVKAKTLEAWVSLANPDQRGGAAISLQTSDGATFDAIVFGERDPRQWMAGSNGFARTNSFQGDPETAAGPPFVQVALVYAPDGTITCYRNGNLYGKPYVAAALQPFAAGKSQVLFGLRHSPPGGNKWLAGAIDRAALYDRALSPEEVAASAGVVSMTVFEDDLLTEMSPELRARREAVIGELSQVQSQRQLLAGGKVYAVNPAVPEAVHLLERGDTRLAKQIVTPGGVQAVASLSANFDLPADAPDGPRRIKLAEWITDPRNPLTARVMVNRVWHHHFGTGIVDTPNDFGFNGGRPTHPELLDWLASELVAGKWSLKHLHRVIVVSAAYRQASLFSPSAAKVDAGNRLLWRANPRRLEAESVRDAILRVAGELNPSLGGPGYQDFRTFNFNSQFYEPTDPVGYAFNRRSVYRTWVRSGRNEFLDVFDCPDPSTTSPKRAVTTTPLQALALLNNSFALRMSDRLAERLKRESGPEIEQQIQRCYDLAYARPASVDEIAGAKQFITRHGLPAFCRVVFNSNEFLYVD